MNRASNDPEGDEIIYFRGFEDAEPFGGCPLPTHKPLPVLEVDTSLVPSSVIRRIQQELRADQCDPRTVWIACRGMVKGTMEFEDAYTMARIRSFLRPRRGAEHALHDSSQNLAECIPEFRRIAPPDPGVMAHPLAVVHLGHLMRHFGLWVIALLAAQGYCAWQSSGLAHEYLLGGRNFHFATLLLVLLALDSLVWFRRRGGLSGAFHFPGSVLFLLALVPIFILHIRSVLAALD